jgi:oligopeptide transport system substrate-binding protein
MKTMPTAQHARSFTRSSLSAILLLALAACSFIAPKAQRQAPTAVAAVIATAKTIAPTATPAPTLTPTPEPTATATATPLPTPTPPGFFCLDSAGFSLTYPLSWEISEQSSSHIVLVDANGLAIMVESTATEDPLPFADYVAQIKDDFSQDGAIVTISESAGEYPLGDGIVANKAEMTLSEEGGDSDVWVLETYHQGRDYTILVLGRSGTLEKRGMILNQVLGSLRLYTPRPFGLERKDTLTLTGGDPVATDLDPATTRSSAEDYVGLLFSGLVRLAPDLQIVPELAERWTISPDETVYTFTLREGIKFASGDPITAEDVKASWERACDPETESTTASTYLGDILGAQAMLDGKADDLSGVRAIDERTLEVTLDGPKPYFLAKLTYPNSFVVDTEQAESDPETWMFEPNSSGPYQIREYQEQVELTFERNPSYFEPAGVPYIAFMLDAGGSEVSLFEEGSIDLAYLSYDEIQEIGKADHPLHAQLLTTPTMCTTLLQINPARAPLDDAQVRKALLLATDRPEFARQMAGDTAILINGVLPPAMPGFLADRSLPGFDPEAAKAALAASQYAGKALTITISASGYGDTQRKDVALLVDMWQKNLGIQVKVEYIDPADFSETIRKDPGHVVIYGWCADYPDPENFLDVLYHTGSRMNVAGVSDADLDSLLEAARSQPDPAQRLALYQQAEDRILDQVYAIPLFSQQRGMLVSPRVKHFVLSPLYVSILPQLSMEEEK